MDTKLRKDDVVQVLSGESKGKTGRIVSVNRSKNTVVVQGVNMVKKALKRRSEQDKGGIVEIEAPIHVSNVNLTCKKCGPTQIKMDLDGKKKVRKCRKCGEVL